MKRRRKARVKPIVPPPPSVPAPAPPAPAARFATRWAAHVERDKEGGRRITELRLLSIDLVGPDYNPQSDLEAVLQHERKTRSREPGRPQVLGPMAFWRDVAAYPKDSIYRRAKRLGISRRTVTRLLQGPEVVPVVGRPGEVLFIK